MTYPGIVDELKPVAGRSAGAIANFFWRYPARHFKYFTDPDKLARWSRKAKLDPVPRGIYPFDMGEWGVIKERLIRIEAPTIVSIEIDGPDASEASPGVWEISVEPEAGGSCVNIRHSGLKPPADLLAGRVMDHHPARLSVVAAGGSPGSDSISAPTMQS